MSLSPRSTASPRPEAGQRTLTHWTVLGLGVALFGLLVADGLLTASRYARTSARTVVLKWVITALLIGIVLYGEGRTLESIGVRRPNRGDVASALLLTVVGFLTLVVTFAVGQLIGLETGDASPGAPAPRVAVVLSVVIVPLTSGVTEELWFRGYALERLETWTASTWIAGVVTVGAFVLLHVPTSSVGGALGISALG